MSFQKRIPKIISTDNTYWVELELVQYIIQICSNQNGMIKNVLPVPHMDINFGLVMLLAFHAGKWLILIFGQNIKGSNLYIQVIL